jgi:hypothetical protein
MNKSLPRGKVPIRTKELSPATVPLKSITKVPILSEYLYKLEGNLTMRVFFTLTDEVLSCYSSNPFEERDPHLVSPMQEVNIANVNVKKMLNRGHRAVSMEDPRSGKHMEVVFPTSNSMDKWLSCVQVLTSLSICCQIHAI